ncbi:hypothetical protein [Kiloniella antarctica]
MKKDLGLTRRDFMKLIKPEEQNEIMAAAVNSPALNMWLYKLSLADDVQLDHPDLVVGMEALVLAGVLTEERKSAILSGQAPA